MRAVLAGVFALSDTLVALFLCTLPLLKLVALACAALFLPILSAEVPLELVA